MEHQIAKAQSLIYATMNKVNQEPSKLYCIYRLPGAPPRLPASSRLKDWVRARALKGGGGEEPVEEMLHRRGLPCAAPRRAAAAAWTNILQYSSRRVFVPRAQLRAAVPVIRRSVGQCYGMGMDPRGLLRAPPELSLACRPLACRRPHVGLSGLSAWVSANKNEKKAWLIRA